MSATVFEDIEELDSIERKYITDCGCIRKEKLSEIKDLLKKI